jgi:Protein of unknown function (DUF3631)
MSSRNGLPEGLLASLEKSINARGGRSEGREIRFLCPAHDDHQPSARWNPEKATWHCDACDAGGGALHLAKCLGVELPAAPARTRRETVYVISDAAGLPIAEHVRQDLAAGGKRFFWRRDGRPGLRGMRSSELPPYGAERVGGWDTSRPVFVAEGEKAATCLVGIGAQAVGTVTGASGTPGSGPLAVLRGREVVLWPDADAAGTRHMERIAAALAGVASSVRIYSPQGLPAGGDAAEWIERRRTAGTPAATILHQLETSAREVAIRAVETVPDRSAETPPGGRAEAALAGLVAAAGAPAIGDCLRQLGEALRGADPLTRGLARESALAALEGKAKAPALLVDAALTIQQPPPASGQGRTVEFSEPVPWPDPVDGAVLLADVAAAFTRFVALPPLAEVAAALWTMHAHALDAAAASPLLALTSPEKRCGKTTTLSLLARLVPRALLSSNISPASLFRIVEKYTPTLLVDEADSFLRDKEELRGILNSGHTRDAAFVVRTVGDENEPRRFSTWAAKAVALIGHLPDTLADRSLVVPMRRRAAGEHVERLRLDRAGGFEDLRRRAARWAADRLGELRGADPEVPSELGDRAADGFGAARAGPSARGAPAARGRGRQAAARLGRLGHRRWRRQPPRPGPGSSPPPPCPRGRSPRAASRRPRRPTGKGAPRRLRPGYRTRPAVPGAAAPPACALAALPAKRAALLRPAGSPSPSQRRGSRRHGFSARREAPQLPCLHLHPSGIGVPIRHTRHKGRPVWV